MLGFHGGVTILDFGIARMAEELRQTHTQVGAVKGKASYMSPEQVQNEEVDQRSDVFAVGVVLHEMLTGQRLFRSSSDASAGRKVMEMPIPLPSTRNPAVPPALDRLVMHALARDRDARYASSGKMAADLDRLMQEERMSSRAHAKLLDELFPHEASATDVQIALPPKRAPKPETPNEAEEMPSRSITPGRDRTSYAVDLGNIGRRRDVRRAGLIVAGVCLLALGMLPVLLHARKHPTSLPAPTLAKVNASAAIPGMAAIAPETRCFLDSTPQGATVTRIDDGRVVGRTPFMIAIPRSKSPVRFRFEQIGRKPVAQDIVPDVDKLVRVDLGLPPAPPTRRRKKTTAARRDFRDATPINPFTM